VADTAVRAGVLRRPRPNEREEIPVDGHRIAAGDGDLLIESSVAVERGRARNYVYGSTKTEFTTFLSGLRNRLSCQR